MSRETIPLEPSKLYTLCCCFFKVFGVRDERSRGLISCFFWKKMGMQLIIMVIKFLVIVGALLFHGSAALDIPSLKAVSVLLHFKVGTPDLSSHGTTRASLTQNDPVGSPMPIPLSFGRKRPGMLVATSPNIAFDNLSPMYHSPTKAVVQRNAMRDSKKAFAPSTLSSKRHANKWVHGSPSSPSFAFYKHHHARNKIFAPEPSKQQGPLISPLHSPLPSSTRWSSPAPSPSPTITSSQFEIPIPPPTGSPSSYSIKKKMTPPPSPLLTLPPPPPNLDCTSVTCTEPLTYTPPGSPCGCVWPIEVRLRLSVALYTFFPLVSELAKEIAAGVSLNRSQVRIMGANAASQQLDKTVVLINLVPLRGNFNDSSVFSIYKKFWRKQVFVKTSLFGAYEVVYVHYPGLPPSPPSVPSIAASMDNQPYPGHDNDGRAIKPLGVDVPRKQKDGLGGSTVAIIVLSSITAFVVCIGVIWILLLKCGGCAHRYEQTPHVLISSHGKPSGAAGSLTFGSRPSSASLSFSSSLVAYTGTAKIFSLNDIERATNNFDKSKILGEGGFGLVYGGILDDERKVAVKRTIPAAWSMNLFLMEAWNPIYMELTRKLAPLDWSARMKIALGAARGLAYLHEDSSPRVIHRDFKSSNILLEQDFTPKVSDFGLARTALDEGNKHISTHVMGTFGYLAPEYAMTGHLLVKSDVYSYGVVLLELLTGRKPVDLSQPPAIASMCVQPEVSHRPFMGEVVQALKLVCNEFDEGIEPISRSCSQEDLSITVDSKLTRVSGELVEASRTHPVPGYDSVFDTKMALSASDLVCVSARFEEQEFGSYRRHSNSAPLGIGRRRHFWQRLRGLSRGSMSEHGFSSKLWSGSR
ncbi:hypothetical protein F0562_024148 [Nyssa sinensis]|uniref:non-specific serine/threonine protein kinase n=1 Tax=Nyssa sinensis TaxID=561372 RepID=A0A5J5BC42_9ASTE|nr:hypothetical protein F0562_024148 [Nyssa sinensis]